MVPAAHCLHSVVWEERMLRSRPLTVTLILVMSVIFSAEMQSLLPFSAAAVLTIYVIFCWSACISENSRKRAVFLLVALTLMSMLSAGTFCRTRKTLTKEDTAEQYYKSHDRITLRGIIYAVEEKDDATAYYLKNVHAEGKDLGRTICYVTNTPGKPRPGDFVEVSGKTSLPKPAPNEGGFDAQKFYRSRNIYGMISKGSMTRVGRPSFSIAALLWKFRRQILLFYQTFLPGEESGILGAIALGSRSDLEEEAQNLFQMSGLAHILAISGMHIGVIGLGFWRLLRRKLSYWISGILVSVLLVLYCVMTGGSISAIRAVTMCIVYMIGQALGEAPDSLSSLSLAGVILLAAHPASLHDSSFIFSFVAVAGVILVAAELQNKYDTFCARRWEKIHFRQHGDRWKPNLKEILVSNLIFSAAMQLVTLPLVAENYYEIPVYVVFLNLILLPMLGWLLGLGLVGGLTGAAGTVFSGSLTGGVGIAKGGGLTSAVGIVSGDDLIFAGLTGIGKCCLLPCHWIIYLYEWLADLSLKLPFSRYITGKPPLWAGVLFYGVLLICVQGKQILGIREEPAGSGKVNSCSGSSSKLHSVPMQKELSVHSENVGKRIYGNILFRIMPICAVTLLILRFPLSHPTEVTMLDVGQGESLYLCDGKGYNMMIDGGSTDVDGVGDRRILPFLKSRGIRHIDIWFVSHTDLDHISGIEEVLESGYRVDRLVFSETMQEEAYREAAEKSQLKQNSWNITGTQNKTSAAEKNSLQQVASNHYDRLCQAARKNGTKIATMKAGDGFLLQSGILRKDTRNGSSEVSDTTDFNQKCSVLDAGNKADASDNTMKISCLWPYAKPTEHGTNENALVLLVRYGSFSAIFGGDIGEAEEQKIASDQRNTFEDMQGVNLYKADHHGSNDSSCEAYLKTLQPDMVWISAGQNNLYGHPGKKALARISTYAHNYFCTISTGQITLRWEDHKPKQYVMRREQ